MKKSLLSILTIFLLISQAHGQVKVENEQKEPTATDANLDHVFDNYGNKYKLNDIRIPKKEKDVATNKSSALLCTSGYFNLYFEDGCGMEGTGATETARRNVICQLFSDISNFINSPLTSNGLNNKVNIWVRDILAFEPGASTSNTLGLASSFYNVPQNTTNGFGGIVDNEIWKTINSGLDSYSNVTTPLQSNGGGQNNSAGIYFHGLIAFNFANSAFIWNDNLAVSPAPAGTKDLYSIALHELTHALGFASLIKYDGNSVLGYGYNYYSRFDRFLQDHTLTYDLLENSNACSMYNYHFNASIPGYTDVLTPGCPINPPSTSTNTDHSDCSTTLMYDGSVQSPIYTPACYESGSSYSHFEDECFSSGVYGNNQYFVMSNANGGTTKRSLKPEERNVLCDLGYSTNSTYGSSSDFTYFDYATSVCPGIKVVGMNDGIIPGSGVGSYAFFGNPSTNINITGLLSNDYFGGTSVPAGATFECLEDVFSPLTTTLSITTGNNSSTVVFNSSDGGLHLLRYVPVYNGIKGNITYVYVYVNNGNCTPSSCDFVNNGNFESVSGPYFIPNCWEWMSATPDAYNRYHTSTTFNLPNGQRPETYSGTPNDGYAGIAAMNIPSFTGWETYQNTLSSPLMPGQSYTLSFWARVENLNGMTPVPAKLQFTSYPNPTPPINIFSQPLSATIPNATDLTAPVSVPRDGSWHYYSVPFVFNGTSPHNLMAVWINNFAYTESEFYAYVFFDDVSIQPQGQLPTLDLPASICNGQTLSDLGSYLTPANSGGVFSGPGVVQNGATFNFDATLAGVGTHNIIYSYTDGFGCSYVVADEIVVGNTSFPINVNASQQELCGPGTVILSATGADTYTWQPGNLSGNSVSVNVNSSITYTVTGTSIYGCLSQAASISITVKPLPTITATASSTAICQGQSVILSTNGGTNYYWLPYFYAATSFSDAPTSTTTYTVISTENGCTNSASVTVTVNSVLPAVTATASPNSICSGESSILTATGANSYSWNNGAGSGSTVNVNPTSTTTYTVTGTTDGCVATASVNVTVLTGTGISIAASKTNICVGETLTLTASGGSNYLWSNGSTSGSITVSPSVTTTYTLTGTSSSGCQSTASITIIVNPNPTISASASTSPICSGTSATLTATGGVSYSWNTGQSGSPIIVSPSSTFTYILTGTDVNGCTGSTSLQLIVKPTPNISSSTYPNFICAGQTSATLTANGATTYTWSNGQTGNTIVVSPTTTTTYTVTGTTNGCVSTSSFTNVWVVQPNNLNIYTNNPTTICQGTTITLQATGYDSYVWSTGQTGSNINVTPSTTTTYSVTGTNYAGCTNTQSITITVNQPSLSVNALPNTICEGESSVLTANGASYYSWNTGQTGNTITVSPISTTTYTVTGTDANGCVANANVEVTVNPSVPISVSASQTTICAGESTVLTASGGGIYLWSTGEGGNTITVSPTSTTTYTVNNNDPAGCSNPATITIIVNEAPHLTVNATQDVLCQGQSTVLNASGADTYTWDNGFIGNSQTVNPMTTTSYTVTGTGLNGCTGTSTITISVNMRPSVTASVSPGIICAGGSSTITASGGLTYSWNTGQTGSTITVSPMNFTTYIVTGTGANGCTNTWTTSVTVQPLPSLSYNVSPSVVCAGQSAVIMVTGAQNYTWSTGQTGNTITVNPTTSSVYTVTGTTLNCSSSLNINVNVNPLPGISINASANTICQGTSVTLMASGGSSYLWSTGQAGNTITVSPSTSSTYSVSGTSSNGCSSPSNIAITVNPIPAVNAGPDVTICNGSGTSLTASGATTYTWSHGMVNGTTVYPTVTTNYTVTGTSSGCTASDQVTVNVQNCCEVHAGFEHHREGCFVNFHAANNSTPGSIVTYSWNFGDPGSGVNNTSNLQVPNHIFSTSGTYYVCLTVTATVNGQTCSDTYCQYISVECPKCEIAPKFDVQTEKCMAYFHDFSSASGTITSWSWNFGDPASGVNNTSNLQNPTHVFTSGGAYTVCLTVTAISGGETCTKTFCMEVKPDCPCKIIGDFKYTTKKCKATFGDLSSTPGTITSWSWNFGDPFSGSANTSTLQNPIHYFSHSGTFNVCLTVTSMESGMECTYTVCKPVTVVCAVSECIVTSAFNFTAVPGTKTRNFTDASTATGTIIAWNWDFGDPGSGLSNVSNLQNPTHTFSTFGLFNVCLTVVAEINGIKCENTYCRKVAVKKGFVGPMDPELELIEMNVFPNPAENETTISLTSMEDTQGEISIFNMYGEYIITLYNGEIKGGTANEFKWDAIDVNPGVYIVKATVGSNVLQERIVITR